MTSNKPFKTYNQQLRILRSRNMEITDSKKAMKILKREGYYNIVNGYKEIFLDLALSKQKQEDWYKNGTTFNHLFALYTFDRALKSCLLSNILKMETFLKTQIAYFFSKKYHQNFSYLDINNFEPSSPEKVTNLISKVSNVITKNSSKRDQGGQVYHYLNKYKELPLWVLVNKMTLGETYHFFDALQTSVKNDITETFINMFNKEYRVNITPYTPSQNKVLSEMFTFINDFRNICAHDNRLFNTVIKGTKGKIPQIDIFHKANHILFKSRLFDCIIILGLFLTKHDYKKMIAQISAAVNALQKELPPNIFNAVLIHMGFSKNWENDLKLP